jgi:hypothetical protein
MDTGAVPPECKQAEGQAPAVQGQMMEHAVQGIVQGALDFLLVELPVWVHTGNCMHAYWQSVGQLRQLR